VEIFPSDPVKYQGDISFEISEFCACKMSQPNHRGKKKTIEKIGHNYPKWRSIPYPPGSSGIKDQNSQKQKWKKSVFDSVFRPIKVISFQIKQGNQRNKKDGEP
jgi:hypothetical protein